LTDFAAIIKFLKKMGFDSSNSNISELSKALNTDVNSHNVCITYGDIGDIPVFSTISEQVSENLAK
jgi:hypothetical protein